MEMDKLKNNMNKKIAIIGRGHMGKAIVSGLLNSGCKKENIFVSNTSVQNRTAIEKADWIIITVKPMIAKLIFADVSNLLRNKLLISAAAALSFTSIETSLKNNKQKIIRIMPNIPVSHNQGVIGLYANKRVSKREKAEVINCLSQLGTVIACRKEEELDAITIISGCGPAVVSYFINALINSATTLGLAKDIAETVALQTFLGTLNYLVVTKQTPIDLQKSVATKGGLTEEIILQFDEKKIADQLAESLSDGYAKIKRIKEEL